MEKAERITGLAIGQVTPEAAWQVHRYEMILFTCVYT